MAAMAARSSPFSDTEKRKPLPQLSDANRKSQYGNNIINRIINREMRGSMQPCRRKRPLRFFSKIPVRSVFRLSSLVSEHILRDGHVFLGFTKTGQLLVSYSVRVETFEPHIDLPLVVYTLHWWHFVPNRKLKKIAESRLFGEQEFLRDNLFIAFCEWPKDDSKVLIYGYSSRTDADEKRDCYITITAVPPISHCSDCRPSAMDEHGTGDLPQSGLCLRHGYTVHTRYELAAPYPLLFPKTHLRMDGVAVMNTGDSLIALSVELESDNHTGGGLMSNTQIEEPAHMYEAHTPASATTSDDFVVTKTDSQADFAENFSPHDEKADDKSSVYDFCEDQNFPPFYVARPYAPLSDKMFEKPSSQLSPAYDACKENKFSKHDNRLSSPSSADCRQADGRGLPWDVLPPCFIKIDDGTCSTASSCYSSPVIYQNESQCFTYSVRKYTLTDTPHDGDAEDDLSVAYHSVLPLEVHGSLYSTMSVVTSQHPPDPQSKLLVVKQLTFDVEQYIAEVLRSSAEFGHRYASFTDYDAQILEVCPESCRVVAMVVVLVRARPPLTTKMDPQRYSFTMYQTTFTFLWNLNTGAYETIYNEDFTELERPKMLRPGAEVAHTMYKQFSIPESYATSVHYLTNDSVFREESLKALIDPQHYVAIVL